MNRLIFIILLGLVSCESESIAACGRACTTQVQSEGWGQRFIPTGGHMLRWTAKEGCLCAMDETGTDGGAR